MRWRCAECGRAEDRSRVKVDAVCHHCGRTLCRTHQLTLDDPAFHDGREAASRRAIHCPDCRRRHHPVIFQRNPGRRA